MRTAQSARRSGSNKLKILELKIAYEDGLTYVQRSYIYNDLIGQVLLQCLNGKLTS